MANGASFSGLADWVRMDTSLRAESKLVPAFFLDRDNDVEEHGRLVLGHYPATGV